MKDVILVGIQGSGKGTQAKKLVERFGFQVLETGAFFRGLRDDESELAERVIATIDRGDYVDDATTMEIVEKLLQDLDPAAPILYDGVPRSEPQRVALEKMLAARGRDFQVIMIDVPEDVTFERLLKRAALEGREDDTEEAIRSRIDLFYELTEPMIAVWEDAGRVIHIDGLQVIDEVADDIADALTATD